MDIKIEPEDDPLSLEASDDAILSANQCNSIWNDAASTCDARTTKKDSEGGRIKREEDASVPLRIVKTEVVCQWPSATVETFDTKMFPIHREEGDKEAESVDPLIKQEPEDLSVDSQEEFNIEWENYKDNFLEEMKIEKFDVGECSYKTCQLDSFISSEIAPALMNDSSSLNAPRSKMSDDEIQIDCERIKKENSATEQVAAIILEKREFFQRNFVCSVCFDLFASFDSLKFHYNERESKFSCGTIKKVSERLKKKRMAKYLKCDQCSFTAEFPCHLKNHKMSHSGEKPFSCHQCEFKCVHLSMLKYHKMTHDGNKPFKCESCAFKFTRLSHLKAHVMSHTGEKPFQCNECAFKCTHLSTLKSHKMTHSGEKPFKCDLCNFKSSQKSSLKSHKMTHTGEKPFKCDLCEFKFTRFCHLKTHMLSHTGEKPFKCDKCDMKYANSSSLKTHKLIHTGEKPFKCDQCDLKFTQSSHLKRHKMLHTGEKPFKCDLCDFKANISANLKRHKMVHTGETPFECGNCTFKTSQASILKRHMFLHTGDRPYKCEQCSFKTVQSSNLKKHLITHTK